MCYTVIAKTEIWEKAVEDLKSVIAKNIVDLRTGAGMTQAELAEKLNYSDKAVSKWERAESMPDITVLKTIADMFGVMVDYLLKVDHTFDKEQAVTVNRRKRNNRGIITGISIVFVWFIATFVFFILDTATNLRAHWLCFVYAVPVSMIVWLVFNSIWFNRRRNFLIISLLMWSLLAALCITLLKFGIWLLFVVGVPGQVIILLWSRIRTRSRRASKK